jgi:hypothetical protein
MTDETTSAPAEPITAVVLPADAPASFNSAESAAKYMIAQRAKQNPSAESADPAPADPELSDEDNAAPATDPGEDAPEVDPAADKPEPIEPPRSWTKAEKDRFATLPRETQEYLHSREQERERDFRRSQNEIADQRKAITAERDAAAKARQQYEAQLPVLMQTLTDAQQSAFSDIRTVDDVQKLAAEDPFRYLQWQAHQTKLQAVNADLERSKGQQAQDHQSKWADHVQKENELAAEFIPELADKVKGPALTQRVARELLPELGFKPDELAALANGKEKLSIYDHRVQRLLATALKYADVQKASKAAVAKTLPPVQRPGTARPSGQANSERIQALTEQLNKTGSLKVAQELRALQASQRRAS